MDAHENTPRTQVLSVSDTGRRRRWTDDEKIRIVEESFGDGVTLSTLADLIGHVKAQLNRPEFTGG